MTFRNKSSGLTAVLPYQIQTSNGDMEFAILDLDSLKASILWTKVTQTQMHYLGEISFILHASVYLDEFGSLCFEVIPELEDQMLQPQILSEFKILSLNWGEKDFLDYMPTLEADYLDLFPFEVLCFNHAEYLLKILMGKYISLGISEENKIIAPCMLTKPVMVIEEFTQKMFDEEYTINFYYKEITDFKMAFQSVKNQQ